MAHAERQSEVVSNEAEMFDLIVGEAVTAAGGSMQVAIMGLTLGQHVYETEMKPDFSEVAVRRGLRS
jgi:hypothetical protein